MSNTEKQAMEKIAKIIGQVIPNSNRLAKKDMTEAALKRWVK
jgi:hypothetical protein